jgi:hypothetical protein
MNKKQHWEKHLENAILYYRNAREELRGIPIEDGFYADKKHVRRAAGTCWLAVVDAAKGFLIKHGVQEEKLRSAEAYSFLLAKHTELDGKLMQHFEYARQIVHIAVYYNGASKIDGVKSGFESAKFVIEKLTGTKL